MEPGTTRSSGYFGWGDFARDAFPHRVFGDLQIAAEGLVLPHPGLHQRNFVLYPLAEIAAELQVPGLARVRRLRDGAPAAGIERLAARGSGDD